MASPIPRCHFPPRLGDQDIQKGKVTGETQKIDLTRESISKYLAERSRVEGKQFSPDQLRSLVDKLPSKADMERTRTKEAARRVSLDSVIKARSHKEAALSQIRSYPLSRPSARVGPATVAGARAAETTMVSTTTGAPVATRPTPSIPRWPSWADRASGAICA